MAESVFLELKSNGNEVQGESSVHSLDREGKIECYYFCDSVRTAREAGSGAASGRRTFDEMKFIKRIDKSSPLLAKALCNNENIEGIFRFYRPNPDGDGTTQQFFEIEFEGGRVASIKRVSPLTFDPASSKDPPYEEVGFVFKVIRWIDPINSTMHEDSWFDNV